MNKKSIFISILIAFGLLLSVMIILPKKTLAADESGSNFDTSDYEGYNNREYSDFEDKFYITPLKNVSDGGTSPDTVYKNLREELAKTGYEAHCLVENVKIAPKYDTKTLIEQWLYYHPAGKTWDIFSKEKLGTNNAEYPIWRDVDDNQFLMTSLEEYFGFKDLIEEDPALSEINTAPINSLLSQQQSCVQGWKSLAAQRRACDRLDQQDECALTKRKIPGSEYEVRDLMGMTSNFFNRHTGSTNWTGANEAEANEKAAEGCNVLFANSDNRDKELTQEEAYLKDSIINVPYYHDRSYRIGFIVAAVETRIPNKSGANEAGLIFNFFTPKTEQNQRDEVLVAAFKLPDIGTNKGPQSDYGHEQWDDPLDLTRMAITTKENQDSHDADKTKNRESILSRAISASNQTSASRIRCANGTGLESATETCTVPLPRALTDIINGTVTNESCENSSEAVSYISDLAGIGDASDTFGKVFKESSGGQVLLNLFFGSLYNDGGSNPGYAEINKENGGMESLYTINDNTWEPGVRDSVVHFYLVYPMGFELDTIEEAIKGAFFTTDQITKMDEDESIVNTFTMRGQTQDLDGGGFSETFPDPDWKFHTRGECGYHRYPFPPYAPNLNDPIVCRETFNVNIAQGGGKANVLGGKLSWWLRKVQATLNAKYSLAHKYYESCGTMEEFLLGRCPGGVIAGELVDPKEAEAVAQCIPGSPRITSGETAEHIPAPGAPECNMYASSIHSIPEWKNGSDPAPECDDEFYSYVACTYPNSLIANPVNSEGEFTADGDITACEFVVGRAKELGISPRFALAMWGEETGFSHYRSANGAFGIHPGVAAPLHLGEQIAALYGTMDHWYPNYQTFLEAYSGEVSGSNQFCNNAEFPARLSTYYYYLSP